jgi:hypothetical protein
METLHKVAEYYVVGIDHSEQPGMGKLRTGVTPRGETSAEELSKLVSDVIQAAIDQAIEEQSPDDVADETNAAILQFFQQAKPVIRKSSDPSLPSIVIIEGDLIPTGLWLAFFG